MEFLNLALAHSLRTVLDQGSLRGAADVLHVSPSAVTQQIRRLEDAVGFPLLIRDHSPVRLTARGREFMLHALQALEASSLALGVGVSTTLRIGFLEGFPRSPDEDLLVRFRSRNPSYRIDFVHLPWGAQIDRLLAGDVDAVLARPPFPPGSPIDVDTVYREPRVAGLCAGSPLADKGSVLLEDLDELPVALARGVSPEWTNYWAVTPRPNGASVVAGPSISTIEEALTAVTMEGAVFITAESVGTRYSHPGVRYLPVDDIPWCEVQLCTRRGDRRAGVLALRSAAKM